MVRARFDWKRSKVDPQTLARLWIDVLTPKQALFTKAMVEEAPSEIECIVTAREYSELTKFLSQLKIEQIVSIGRHGGAGLLEKLSASVERQKDLIPFVTKLDIDVSVSYMSPEAARVSFGLGIPHYVCSDSPHASAPSKLTVPLSSIVFTPFPIEKDRWTQYGIKRNKVLKYRALDPWAWLKHSNFRASTTVNGRVMIRLEESFASYFKQGKGISIVLSKLIDGIKAIGDFEITLVPRYDDQRAWAKREFGTKCFIPDTTIDGPEEISKTDLLIGGGATMTQEAALLGVPNISYFPSAHLDVFTDYYFPKKMSIDASTPATLLNSTFSLLRKIDDQKKIFIQRAMKETARFEDPVKFVFIRLVEEALPGK